MHSNRTYVFKTGMKSVIVNVPIQFDMIDLTYKFVDSTTEPWLLPKYGKIANIKICFNFLSE